MLLDPAALAPRRALATGAGRPLADSLAAELDRLPLSADPFIPAEKAKLTHAGGRCARDGVLLEFDPRSPRQHRCPHCGATYDGDEHYRWWVMGYQLWLAERAVHAAVLWALRGEPRHGELAEGILRGLAARYDSYPNADNVLGPTRLFFSTYLESIWLLQVAAALDVLEAAGGATALGATVRERIVEPSAQLIASYDEGDSNRQVWNNAAIAAAGVLLDRGEWTEQAVFGASGLVAHLATGLLADGTWYEGENYHLFAHRGLWYGVAIAERAGLEVPAPLAARFEEGFATPFLTALPDFTFPARRDSQYRVSLRQWRIAEMCELGSARRADERLARALAELYRSDVAAGDTARWRSTADAERNVPGVRLTRADLGWKSLLFADPATPTVEAAPANMSALLEGQGLAILRRDAGRVYVALDYGTSGGGHGHPDRLNLWLVDGADRVLEDVGTGSYVDTSLHWYRSTLAHNAPLVDGRSQDRVDGTLLAWEESGGDGWVRAEADVAPGVRTTRTVVVRESYLADVTEWSAARPVTLDLPFHVPRDPEPPLEWRPASLVGRDGEEDGFRFIRQAERARANGPVALPAPGPPGWITAPADAEWWRCLAPGPPGSAARPFLLVRATGETGRIVSIWSWRGEVCAADARGDTIVVHYRDGTRDEHTSTADGWRIREHRTGPSIDRWLRGMREPVRRPESGERRRVAGGRSEHRVPALPDVTLAPGDLSRGHATGSAVPALRFRLGEPHYRRSEASWREAQRPEALVSLAARHDRLAVEVSVRKPDLCFAPPRDSNPLDNEHPDINSDGLQLHLVRAAGESAPRSVTWLIVPDRDSTALRITPRSVEAAAVRVDGSWRRTPQGYQVLLWIPREACGTGRTCRMDLIINEISPGRERRRGQLVLSGARHEWIYLRGDRQEPDRALTFILPDA